MLLSGSVSVSDTEHLRREARYTVLSVILSEKINIPVDYSHQQLSSYQHLRYSRVQIECFATLRLLRSRSRTYFNKFSPYLPLRGEIGTKFTEIYKKITTSRAHAKRKHSANHFGHPITIESVYVSILLH